MRDEQSGAGKTVVAAGVLAVTLLLGGTSPGDLRAQEQEAATTRVTVRAVASDAKIIGSGVGGARVTIRSLTTGEVLAQGIQEGSTGSTERIMARPRDRGATVYGTEGAAAYVAEIPLTRPTPVEVTARGPLGTPHAAQRASTTLLLLPGHDVTGEGVILELRGFTVELLRPERPVALPAGSPLPVRARITMLCGCPTRPGGMWNADRIERTARLVDGSGRTVAETGLTFSGETSVYEGELPAPAPGAYELVVTAADPGRANFGITRRTVVVTGG